MSAFSRRSRSGAIAAVIPSLTMLRISLAVAACVDASVLNRFAGVTGGGVAALSRRRFCAFALMRAICAASSAVKSSPESSSTMSILSSSANREQSERRESILSHRDVSNPLY